MSQFSIRKSSVEIRFNARFSTVRNRHGEFLSEFLFQLIHSVTFVLHLSIKIGQLFTNLINPIKEQNQRKNVLSILYCLERFRIMTSFVSGTKICTYKV